MKDWLLNALRVIFRIPRPSRAFRFPPTQIEPLSQADVDRIESGRDFE